MPTPIHTSPGVRERAIQQGVPGFNVGELELGRGLSDAGYSDDVIDRTSIELVDSGHGFSKDERPGGTRYDGREVSGPAVSSAPEKDRLLLTLQLPSTEPISTHTIALRAAAALVARRRLQNGLKHLAPGLFSGGISILSFIARQAEFAPHYADIAPKSLNALCGLTMAGSFFALRGYVRERRRIAAAQRRIARLHIVQVDQPDHATTL